MNNYKNLVEAVVLLIVSFVTSINLRLFQNQLKVPCCV